MDLEASTIRRILKKRGYKWLAKAQKRKYSKADMIRRQAFAENIVRMSAKQLREKLSIAMDGVVITSPPEDAIERDNFCHHGETHMYRLPSEAAKPELAGKDHYHDQVPADRVIPLWGGISEGGFAIITMHARRKLCVEDFVKIIRAGEMTRAIKEMKPPNRAGPWTALCDNESFLSKSKQTRLELAKKKISLMFIPPRSPDLNPVERFWGWLRKELRRLDLLDLKNKRPVMSKVQYKQRVKRVCKTKRAQVVASNYAKSLKRVCKLVIEKKGAHSGL